MAVVPPPPRPTLAEYNFHANKKPHIFCFYLFKSIKCWEIENMFLLVGDCIAFTLFCEGQKTFLLYLSDILIKPLIKEDEGPGELSNRKYEKGNLFPTFSRAIFFFLY